MAEAICLMFHQSQGRESVKKTKKWVAYFSQPCIPCPTPYWGMAKTDVPVSKVIKGGGITSSPVTGPYLPWDYNKLRILYKRFKPTQLPLKFAQECANTKIIIFFLKFCDVFQNKIR